MSWLCFMPVHGNYLVHMLPSMLVMPIGYGMTFAPLYPAATSSVPGRHGRLASGLITTSQRMGGAVGLAIISGIAASFTASLIHDSAPQALTSGYDLAMAISVGLTSLALALAAVVIRVPKPEAASPGSRPAPQARSIATCALKGRSTWILGTCSGFAYAALCRVEAHSLGTLRILVGSARCRGHWVGRHLSILPCLVGAIGA